MKHLRNASIMIFIAAILCVFCIYIYAASNSETINAVMNRQISIQYNGKVQTMYDANDDQVYPISYNGTTYLPIRALCDLFGIVIEWDEEIHSVKINETQVKSVNDVQYLKIAMEYALKQISIIEKQQKYLFEQADKDKTKEYKLDILYARVSELEYDATYNGCHIFHYKVEYLPNDAAFVIPAAGEWEITNDGWYADKRPLYLVFTDADTVDIVGEFICEFSPQGNSKQFYEDFDLWLKGAANGGE